MLFLITGQPGNGKTLHALTLVEKLRTDPASLAIGRQVYYWGIPQLDRPWHKLGTDEDWIAARQSDWSGDCPWYDLPDGSIVVVDECQHVFRPRKQGAAVPKRVSQLETHRHRGFDIFVITQHPQLLDINVRKLVGRHIHVKRNFGREVATLYQWEECVNPQDKGVTNRALKTTWSFPKDVYGWYHSAEVHTVKKDFPLKPVLTIVGSLVAVALLVWFTVHRLRARADAAPVEVAASQSAPLETEKVASWSTQDFVPRVPTWHWSAPFYDQVAKVQNAPRVIGCMRMDYGDRVECRCSNGQGDAQVDDLTCHNFMEGRIYDPTRPPEDIKAENIRRLESSAKQGGDSAQSGTTYTQPRQTEAAGRS